MPTELDFQIAPCLREGPVSQAAQQAVEASRNLADTKMGSFLKCAAVPYLFESMEKVFTSQDSPAEGMSKAFLSLAETFKFSNSVPAFNSSPFSNPVESDDEDSVEQITGNHYGHLFSAFSDRSYWDEPKRLLQERLERNGIGPEAYRGKRVLDAGCGGGRYTAAWRLLGASAVVGVDFSEVGLSAATEQIERAGIDSVRFEQASVLELPFENDSFDIVFSNGVLHHTTDWQKGMSEMLRVLKRGGWGWLYLIENPGGLFWDTIEVLRLLTQGQDKAFARQALALLGLPANRIFYMLDHVMVPINLRLTPTEISECLAENGAIEIRRLQRGADFDRIEQIHRGVPYAEIKFGVGENRFVFFKSKD